MNKAKTKAVGYIRVSTNEQAQEGVSLDNQRNKIKVYAELKDLDLVEIISDRGLSGKNLRREGIQRLIKMATRKEIDAVVVYKLDRLTRKTRDLLYLVEDVFNKNDTAFFSLNENIDTTTAQGKFFLTITGAMAQMVRDEISERTKDALGELKRQGRRLGSPDRVPLGLTQTNRSNATISDLVPNQELTKVQTIFDLRRDNHSLKRIGDIFGMGKSSIKYILENPIYKELQLIKVQ